MGNTVSDQRIAGVLWRPLKTFANEAGRVVPILSCEDVGFTRFGRVYLSTNRPGVAKGWHYHAVQVEYFAVIQGIVMLVLYDKREDSPTRGLTNVFQLSTDRLTIVEIPPRVVHGIKTTGGEESLVIICASESYNVDFPDKTWVDSGDVPYHWDSPN